jgi:hypothetical protein
VREITIVASLQRKPLTGFSSLFPQSLYEWALKKRRSTNTTPPTDGPEVSGTEGGNREVHQVDWVWAGSLSRARVGEWCS